MASINIGSYSIDWQIYESLDYVDVYYRYSDCSDPANGFYPEYILFKVVNKTDKKVYVYWDYTAQYDGNQDRVGDNENLVQIFLDPNQSIKGSAQMFLKTNWEYWLEIKLKNRYYLTTV